MKKVSLIKNLFLTLKSEIIFFNLKHISNEKSLLIYGRGIEHVSPGL